MGRNRSLIFEFFYVGDGDATLIEFPNRETLGIIDSHRPSWRDRSPIAEALEARLNNKKCKNGSYKEAMLQLEFVCVTHPHRDHVCGLLDVLRVSGVEIKEFWHSLPDIEQLLLKHASPEENMNYSSWTEISRFYYEDQIKEFIEFGQNAIEIVGAKKTRPLREMQVLPDIEGVEIYVLNPTQQALAAYQEAMDNRYGRLERIGRKIIDNISVALLFVYGQNALLYASDMQKERWKEIISNFKTRNFLKQLLPVHVAKASHHGGPLSFYDNLWNDMLGVGRRGQIIVSGGSLVHPSDEMIISSHRAQKKVYCTGMGKMCGRGEQVTIEQLTFPTRQWFQQYDCKRVSDYKKPCRGNIRVTLPQTGPPVVETTHRPTQKVCKPDQTGIWVLSDI